MEKNENIYKQQKIVEENIAKVLKEKNKKKIIKRRKRVLIGILVIIMVLGILNIFSISYYRNGILNKSKYCLYLGLGLFCYCLLSSQDYRILKNKYIGIFMYSISFLVLIFLAVGGKFFPSIVREINGATGWIVIGSFGTIQPAELLKVVYIVSLAKIFSKCETSNKSIFETFKFSSLILIVFSILIFFENDLGTIIHYICIYIFMFFFTKITKKKILEILIPIFSAGGIILTLIYRGNSSNYKLVRIRMFLQGIFRNINLLDKKEGYQVAQSLLAFGNGGILGRSYGSGVQKYNYLPEIHTDFIMALFGEELGFIGLLFVIFLFFLLYNLILEIGLDSKDTFGKYLAVGIGGFIITQFLINFFVVLGLLPVFGIPMPLFSYGGSSIITIMVAMGIVASINNVSMFDKK